MDIASAQREMRHRFVGGCYGQLVSGLLWLAAAAVATWRSPQAAIATIVVGGFFIFPLTELLVRRGGARCRLSPTNNLPQLGAQLAFVLPLSMPLLLPVARYRLEWFFPALMILVGAHYLPFVFLYGMRMFALLAALLVGAGIWLALRGPADFALGAWLTAALLLVFAAAGRVFAAREGAGAPVAGAAR